MATQKVQAVSGGSAPPTLRSEGSVYENGGKKSNRNLLRELRLLDLRYQQTLHFRRPDKHRIQCEENSAKRYTTGGNGVVRGGRLRRKW